jgi:hypothetical protein
MFWLNPQDDGESVGRVAFLCDELRPLPQALPDVLRQIGHIAPLPAALPSEKTQSMRLSGSATGGESNPRKAIAQTVTHRRRRQNPTNDGLTNAFQLLITTASWIRFGSSSAESPPFGELRDT